MRMDKAQAQLTRISNDASIASRGQGLVILNPIHPGRVVPVAVSPLILWSPVLALMVVGESVTPAGTDHSGLGRDSAITTRGNRGIPTCFGVHWQCLARSHCRSQRRGSKTVSFYTRCRSNKQVPKRMMHSQFFCLTAKSPKSTSQTYTHQNASSTSHPSLADAHLKMLINETRTKMRTPSPPRPIINGETSDLTEEELEEKKRIEREAGRLLAHLEERVKDLEVEASCAKAREDEANKLVEEYARVHAETR